MRTPIVSICCITYNHCNYIRQCIDGFLMQKADFPIEIIVHDDASTDGTKEIINEYALKYPNLVKVILQDENQYSKGKNVLPIVFERAVGKYIALCEGDDYWTDPLKLQKQVDFLEKNPDCVLCSHLFNKYVQSTGEWEYNANLDWANRMYSLQTLVQGAWPLQTATMLFLKNAINPTEVNSLPIFIDLTLVYLLLKKGNAYCLKDNMSVYRLHDSGVWSGCGDDEKWVSALESRLAIYQFDMSPMAAQMVKKIANYPIGRKCYAKYLGKLKEVVLILKKEFGLKYSIRWIVQRLCLGKRMED